MKDRRDRGPNTKLEMKKSQGNAGFCIKASGGAKDMKILADILNGIDLSKHQLKDEAKRK